VLRSANAGLRAMKRRLGVLQTGHGDAKPGNGGAIPALEKAAGILDRNTCTETRR
jgi:hypothetical protein